MRQDLQHVQWTSRTEIASDLGVLLDQVEGALRERALHLLCVLADDDDLPVLEREAARPDAPRFVLEAFATLGGRLAPGPAASWLERDPESLGWVARALDPAHVELVSQRLATAPPEQLRRWYGHMHTAPPGTAAAGLAHELLARWLPSADASSSDRWTLEQALPNPRAIAALVALPASSWPHGLIELLWSNPGAVLRHLRSAHPFRFAELVNALALPADVLLVERGGRAVLLDSLRVRLQAIEDHAAAEAELLDAAVAGAVLGGRVAARIKGGWRIALGPFAAFAPASRSGTLEVGQRSAFRVLQATRRNLAVEPIDGPATELTGPAEVPLADMTLRFAASWRPATELLNRALAGAAQARVFGILRRVNPAAATAWAVANRPSTPKAWVARIDARARGPLGPHVDELVDALAGSGATRDAVFRVLSTVDSVPQPLLDALANAELPQRQAAMAQRILVRSGVAPLDSLEAIADDPQAPRHVRGVALSALPEERLRPRAEQWLRQAELAPIAAHALAGRGDPASLTVLLRASLDPSSPWWPEAFDL